MIHSIFKMLCDLLHKVRLYSSYDCSSVCPLSFGWYLHLRKTFIEIYIKNIQFVYVCRHQLIIDSPQSEEIDFFSHSTFSYSYCHCKLIPYNHIRP